MSRKWSVLLVVITVAVTVTAAACISSTAKRSTLWVETIGNETLTIGMTAAQMPDGNYVVVGMTNATSRGLSGEDFLVAMVKPNGTVLWERTYGGKSWDYAISVAVSKSGKIAIGGSSGSFGGAWLLLLNEKGEVLGQFKYSGMAINALEFDGNYIIAAGRYGMNAMLLKISSNGSPIWSYVINNTGVTVPSAIHILSNGDILVAGTTSGFGKGGNDFWLAEFNPDGRMIWQRAYGGGGEDILYGMAVDKGSIYLAGTTNSFDLKSYSALIIKTDLRGNVKWAEVLIPPREGWANSIAASKSGLILGGISYTVNGSYAWLAGVTPEGKLEWQRFFGGTGMTWVKSVKTVSGGYIAVGSYEARGSLILLKPPESRSVLVMKLSGEPPLGNGFMDADFKMRTVQVSPSVGKLSAESRKVVEVKETNAVEKQVILPVEILWRSG